MINDLFAEIEKEIRSGTVSDIFRVYQIVSRTATWKRVESVAQNRGFSMFCIHDQNMLKIQISVNTHRFGKKPRNPLAALGIWPMKEVEFLPLLEVKRKIVIQADGRSRLVVSKIIPYENELFTLPDDAFFDEVEKSFCMVVKDAVKGLLALNHLLENNTPDQNRAFWYALCNLYSGVASTITTVGVERPWVTADESSENQFLLDYFFQDSLFGNWKKYVEKYPELAE